MSDKVSIENLQKAINKFLTEYKDEIDEDVRKRSEPDGQRGTG